MTANKVLPQQQNPSVSKFTWVVVLLTAVVAAAHIWKVPAALEIIREDFGMTLVAGGTYLSIVQLAGMLGGLVVGLMADLIGLRRGVILGLVFLAVGSLLGAITPNTGLLMVSRAIEGVGFMLIAVITPQIIRQVTSGKTTNLAMGVWGAYQGIANLVAVLATVAALLFMDWRTWWVLFAVLALVPVPWIMKMVPADKKPTGTSRKQNFSLALVRTMKTVKTLPPWIAGIAFGCYTAIWGAIIGFMPTVLEDAGYTAVMAGVIGAFIGGANMIGAISSGPLIERGIKLRYLLMPTFVIMGVTAYLGFGLDIPMGWRIFFVMIFSAVGSFIPASLMRLAVDLAPQDGSTSAVVGLMQQLFNTGNFLGPILMALLAQWTSGWEATIWFTSALALLGLIMSAYLREDRLGIQLTSTKKVE